MSNWNIKHRNYTGDNLIQKQNQISQSSKIEVEFSWIDNRVSYIL